MTSPSASSEAESDTSIRWQERGQLRHRGMTFPAARLLRFSNEGDGWQVRFSDGRLFHPWRPGETAIHPCGLDLYEGTFDIDRSHGPVTAEEVAAAH